MNFKVVIQSGVQNFVKDNASTILTAGGVVGTVATAVLAGRASVKAHTILERERFHLLSEQHGEELDQRDADALPRDERGPLPKMPEPDFAKKLVLVGPLYLGTVLTGATTIAAIVFANHISAQRAAALAAAYGMSQKHFDEYKAKVEEKLGLAKNQKVQDDLAQDRVNRTPGSSNIVIIEGGDVLCFDQPTGRYFKSTMEKIRQAVNQCNEEILHHDFVSADHFYGEIGLPPTTWGNEVGFNTDNLIELEFSTVRDDFDRPCLAIDFKRLPSADYQRRMWGN